MEQLVVERLEALVNEWFDRVRQHQKSSVPPSMHRLINDYCRRQQELLIERLPTWPRSTHIVAMCRPVRCDIIPALQKALLTTGLVYSESVRFRNRYQSLLQTNVPGCGQTISLFIANDFTLRNFYINPLSRDLNYLDHLRRQRQWPHETVRNLWLWRQSWEQEGGEPADMDALRQTNVWSRQHIFTKYERTAMAGLAHGRVAIS